jgi:hypothetical protein
MMAEHKRIHIPTLEERAQVVWEVEALAECDDPELAKRLTAARYWRETRRPDEHCCRTTIVPEPEIPPCEP